MTSRHLSRLLASLPFLILTGGASAQSTWWVDAAGLPPGTGTVSDPYVEIRVALAAASTVAGDRIHVLPGVYLESDIDFLGKDVQVVSTDGPLSTIVDAQRQSSCFVFRTSEGPQARLEGLTLRNGAGILFPIGTSSLLSGGGVFIQAASPTIVGCRIVENDVDPEIGGGVFLYDSSARFVDCIVSDNSGYRGAGAAIWLGEPRFEGCRFEGNGGYHVAVTPQDGGGVLSLDSSPTFEDCAFVDNVAANGGGLKGPATIDDCWFEGNIGQFGGGVSGDGGKTKLDGCTLLRNFGIGYKGEDGFGGGAFNCKLKVCSVVENVASSGGGVHSCEVEGSLILGNHVLDFDGDGEAGRGGGATDSDLIYCMIGNNVADDPPQGLSMGGGVYGSAGSSASSTVLCVLFRNRASIGAGASGADLDRCTVADNVPAAGHAGVHDSQLESCIVRRQELSLSGASSAEYSNIEGGGGGLGNIDLAARFVDPTGADYHLLLDSPSIDAGSPSAPLEADGTRADMGGLPSADCNSNGRLDAVDLMNQVSADQNGNGFPDECECKAESVCSSLPNSSGTNATIGLAGSVRIGENDLTLLANGCPPDRSGVFFYGPRRVALPFGDGLRCVAGQLFRFPLVDTDPQGAALQRVDNAMPPSLAGQVSAGSVWYFQFYFRDPGGPGATGVNLTDALRVRFCD